MTNAQNNVKYGKFRIGDLFYKANVGFKKKNPNPRTDVSKEKNNEFDLPVVSVMTLNNGIMYYGRSSEWTSVTNSIDIVQNGAKATGCVFYQSQATSSFRDAYLVKYKEKELSREESLYMVSALKTVLPYEFNRERLATWTRVQNAYVSLPVTPSGTPDFEYMEERIRELEAYLKVTGLSDATLTKADQDALDKMNNGGVKWKKFKINTILDKPIAGNVDIQRKDISNNGEFVVTSGLTNYGIQGHTTKSANIVNDPSLTIDMFGNVFYRDEPYKLVTHGRVYGFTSKLIKNRETGLFLTTVLHSLYKKFSYNNMFTWNKIKDLEIALPVTPAGDIDFDFMENYITAIEKQSIRGVIEYKDKVIQTTKDVVNAN